MVFMSLELQTWWLSVTAAAPAPPASNNVVLRSTHELGPPLQQYPSVLKQSISDTRVYGFSASLPKKKLLSCSEDRNVRRSSDINSASTLLLIFLRILEKAPDSCILLSSVWSLFCTPSPCTHTSLFFSHRSPSWALSWCWQLSYYSLPATSQPKIFRFLWNAVVSQTNFWSTLKTLNPKNWVPLCRSPTWTSISVYQVFHIVCELFPSAPPINMAN